MNIKTTDVIMGNTSFTIKPINWPNHIIFVDFKQQPVEIKPVPGTVGSGDNIVEESHDIVKFTPWSTNPEEIEGSCDGGLEPEETKTREDCMNGGWEDYGFRNPARLCALYTMLNK